MNPTPSPVFTRASPHVAATAAGARLPGSPLQAVVDAGGRDLLFLATHIDYRPDDAGRLANVEQLREGLAEYGKMPALSGGDFNDVPASRTYAAMAAMFDDVWAKAGDGVGFTIPSREPNKRIPKIVDCNNYAC